MEGSEEHFDENEPVDDGLVEEERSTDGEDGSGEEVDESEGEGGRGPEGSDFAAEEGYEEGGPNAEEGHEEVWDEVQEALSTMNDAFYKDALEKVGKDLLFGLVGLDSENLDLNQDLNTVVDRLNTVSLVENISRFRKVMQMCSAFDPEKGKEYLRKSKMVLLELPLPEDYTQESLKNYVMGHGVPSKPDESEADTTRDIEEAKVPKEKEEKVLSVKCLHGSETPK